MDRRDLLAIGGVGFGGIAAAMLAAGTTTAAQAATDPAAEAIRQFAATLSAHDMDAFAALFADDYVNHQLSAAAPPPAGVQPKQGTVGFFAARLKGLPDLKVVVEASVVGDGMAAASFVYSGTHQGTYFGVAPTGRTLKFTSCDIFRLRDGKFVEHWGMGDIAGVMAQLKA